MLGNRRGTKAFLRRLKMVVTIKATDATSTRPATIEITIMDQTAYLKSLVLNEGMRQEALRGAGPRVVPIVPGPVPGGGSGGFNGNPFPPGFANLSY